MSDARTLRIRWLGTVGFDEALDLQRSYWGRSSDDHLLLLEHPHTFTLGVRARREHLLVPDEQLGAEVVEVDRGGDVTYHGPGQLVGYPIRTVPTRRGGGMADTAAYVSDLEEMLIEVLHAFGIGGGRIQGSTGVWVDSDGPRPRKIAAIGVRLSRGRSMHGFALNIDPDLTYFERIVPCGIADKGVTSMRKEGSEAGVAEVVREVSRLTAKRWAPAGRFDLAMVTSRGERSGVVGDVKDSQSDAAGSAEASGISVRLRERLQAAGTGEDLLSVAPGRKPEWIRAHLRHGPGVLDVRRQVRSLELVTVCEEAGCPNLSDCWEAGTATFMINGDRCTRSCGFCLVDTRKPAPLDPGEPRRVAEAVERMGLNYAVITSVARDDLADGGAHAFAEVVEEIRSRAPQARVEVLIPDFRGRRSLLEVVLGSLPEVLNHNIETVARLHRAVRPEAGYARSLSVLARAKEAGLTTKSGLMVGLGETDDEVAAALADLAALDVDIVTIGQYLRPTGRHIPVQRWLEPVGFERLADLASSLGIRHVEASPLTRSSFHAGRSHAELIS